MDLQWWREFGKCKNLTAEQVDKIFFINRGGSAVPARKFCADCPVRSPCLDYAILYDEKGIWGGTTELERRHLSYLKDLIKQRALTEGTLESRDHQLSAHRQPVQVVQQVVKQFQAESVPALLDDISQAIQALQLLAPLQA